ncbi:hypothetical protein SERLA73DRAFT_160461 [Serpula lacrymans var. lacrymans S7.3]|uniref:Uncharacterized protein n=2 Tax=Serpula lacrymans var. lacrymans TaxID=341189 RepID=F8PY42_SERL3|nr:uncharacterized protein SERLADRAFT_467599 [Serpula lacrymans var. lacrymans S7.9]EGN98805.1 hypothetical protein SERLA73DRAFT_160461 [Serpula lacrymans var. lacrymans S7.3]EGO24396.1 hypothetical protein SERLADRAFT_467599 [Serpula lacrymans var. lacrymans S7.9]
MESSTTVKTEDAVKHSEPIPIGSHHARYRSASMSSASSGSPGSPPQLQTPLNVNPPRIPTASPSSSPILSYFMTQSPNKGSATFPFKRGFAASPVFEEEVQDEFPITSHARRASTAGRFIPQSAPDAQQDRGAGLLRRLSLGGAFNKSLNGTTEVTRPQSPPRPSTPPNTAVTPTGNGSRLPTTPSRTKGRRSATLSVGTGPRRAPSPMGERILKGHFDGFN